MSEYIANIGEFVVGQKSDILTALGLGSCVACILYDKVNKIGGLAHIMLPNSAEIHREQQNMNKFADKAIPNMINEMKNKGASQINIVSKIIGGAQMFPTIINMEDIGKKNIESVKLRLKENNIRTVFEETGGNIGRTVIFNTENNVLKIKTKEGIKEITE